MIVDGIACACQHHRTAGASGPRHSQCRSLRKSVWGRRIFVTIWWHWLPVTQRPDCVTGPQEGAMGIHFARVR